ncbi:MAG: patatin family protein [Bacteroidales bacterium]|nr:patatin family protein [Bacteroidales bacterium]
MRYILDDRSSLVLEGGGMRGVFTCGVLDNLMERGIRFPFSIGVSAGACNGLSYMSGQKGRAKFSNIDLLAKYDYVGLRYLFTQRNIMDFKLLFEKFPQEIIPYDYKAYASAPERFVMVTTNCITGEPNYFEEKESPERIIDIVRASSSLPYVCPIAHVDGIPMLDGGIADSIPVRYACGQGFPNSFIVLTRNRGYRKQIKKEALYNKLFYRKFPHLQKAILQRNAIYNATLDYIEEMEDKGLMTVLRPQKPLQVDRVEKDISKLSALYEEGYDLASAVDFVK